MSERKGLWGEPRGTEWSVSKPTFALWVQKLLPNNVVKSANCAACQAGHQLLILTTGGRIDADLEENIRYPHMLKY